MKNKEINDSNNSKLEIDKKSLEVRSQIILFWAKVFSILYWKNENTSLTEFSKSYINKTWTNIVISNDSQKELQEFLNLDRGVILLDHSQFSNFSDYLPLFSLLWEEVLSKCIFYTWSWNVSMNKKFFPNYTFRWANPIGKTEAIDLLESIKNDIDKINNQGGFIFLVPSWPSNNSDIEFKWIANRILNWLDDNIKSLSVKVDKWIDYKTMFINSFIWNIWDINLSTKITEISNWKWLSNDEMRAYQNDLLTK